MGGISAPPGSTLLWSRPAAFGSSYSAGQTGGTTRYYPPSGAGASQGVFVNAAVFFTDAPPGGIKYRNGSVTIGANTCDTASTLRVRDTAGTTFATVTIPALAVGNFEVPATSDALAGAGNAIAWELVAGGTALQAITPSGFQMEVYPT